jgi:hypothetical protein
LCECGKIGDENLIDAAGDLGGDEPVRGRR